MASHSWEFYLAQLEEAIADPAPGRSDAATQQLLTLATNPAVPRDLRVDAWQHLAVDIDHGAGPVEEYLDNAMKLCLEMEAIEDNEAVQRQKWDTQHMIDLVSLMFSDEEDVMDDGAAMTAVTEHGETSDSNEGVDSGGEPGSEAGSEQGNDGNVS